MSSSKRPSLAESMRAAAAPELPAAPPAPPPVTQPPAAALTRHSATEPPADRPAGYYAATRAGKKKVTATLDPADHKQLKALAVEREVTTEALLAEAIRDLFEKHGRKGR